MTSPPTHSRLIDRLRDWRVLAIVVGVLVPLWIALVLLRVRPEPSPAAQQSWQKLKFMQTDPFPPGRNAWEELWFTNREIPPALIGSLFAVDVRRYLKNQDAEEEDVEPLIVDSDEYPERSKWSDPDLCQPRAAEDCLALVREHEADIAEIMVERAEELAAADRLASADYLRSPFPISLDLIVRPWPGSRLAITEPALLWVQGQRELAQQRLCHRAVGWRRLLMHNDAYIQAMIAQSHFRDAVELLAQMRAEVPKDFPLPADCVQLTETPALLALQQCRAAATELVLLVQMANSSVYASDYAAEAEIALRAGIDVHAFEARVAHLFDHLECRATPSARRWPDDYVLCGKTEFALDPAGCALLRQYAMGMQRLMRIGPSHRCISQALGVAIRSAPTDVPAALAKALDPACEVDWSAADQTLTDRIAAWNGSEIEMPLAGSRIPQSDEFKSATSD